MHGLLSDLWVGSRTVYRSWQLGTGQPSEAQLAARYWPAKRGADLVYTTLYLHTISTVRSTVLIIDTCINVVLYSTFCI